jgi:hypothetical protein
MTTFTGTGGSDLFTRTVATDTTLTVDGLALGAGYNLNAGRGNNANH